MRLDYLRVAGLALLFFVPFLGGVHLFDWDEINFAECAREMLITGDFTRPQIDFEPYWEMPPFFLWLQALSMRIFGVSEFAARFPNAIGGVLTLMLVYHLGRRLHDRVFGWLWVLAWLGSFLPHLYFRSGISDPWFNLLVFGGLYGFIEFRWLFFTRFEGRNFWQRYRYLLLGGWLIGLAVLTKGPLAFLLVMLTLVLYWARYRFHNKVFFKHLLLFSVAAFSVPLLWFGVETYWHGPAFVQQFLAHQLRLLSAPGAGYSGFFGFQALALLLGCFPASLFALPNLWGDRQSEDEVLESDTLASCKRSDMSTWMQLLFWVVLVLFSIFQTKIVYYSSLAYFPLTYLGSLTLWRAIRWDVKPRIVGILLPVVGFLLGLLEMLLPMAGWYSENLKPFFAGNPFLQAKLDMKIEWYWWQGLPGLLLIVAIVAGWLFWRKSQAWWAAQTVYAGGTVFVAFTLLFCIRNFEQYIQNSNIEFYESKAGENCSINPVGFKSYAHLFYAQKQPFSANYSPDGVPGLPHGQLEKKMYFVARAPGAKALQALPGCRELFRKDGIIYFEKTNK
ncbi:MAG: glycosyltransferase family 39 protein [Saprospirales bacterium]|jgi:4-amino-4-deoxy-L-arabinose transferase-like glycosyltransferase|nr:glycosyltransferase family 39 protein [Saprospirales bacterium]MBK8921362.1 glycosyltransferase family 39 protein [Saprospirales bacterium]